MKREKHESFGRKVKLTESEREQMKYIRNMFLAAIALCMTVSLTACGGVSQKDATTYIQGELDAVYRGIYNEEYLDLVEDMTQSEAEEKHRANVAAEAEFFLSFLDVEYPNDEVTAKAENLVKEIYSKAKYTVGEADKLQSGDYVVEVVISPIEIMDKLSDETARACWEEACAKYGITDMEELTDITEEEYAEIDVAYGMNILEKVKALLPELSYGEDQNVMLHLELGEDDYYTLAESGWQKLDEIMIDYAGAYVE